MLAVALRTAYGFTGFGNPALIESSSRDFRYWLHSRPGTLGAWNVFRQQNNSAAEASILIATERRPFGTLTFLRSSILLTTENAPSAIANVRNNEIGHKIRGVCWRRVWESATPDLAFICRKVISSLQYSWSLLSLTRNSAQSLYLNPLSGISRVTKSEEVRQAVKEETRRRKAICTRSLSCRYEAYDQLNIRSEVRSSWVQRGLGFGGCSSV